MRECESLAQNAFSNTPNHLGHRNSPPGDAGSNSGDCGIKNGPGWDLGRVEAQDHLCAVQTGRQGTQTMSLWIRGPNLGSLELRRYTLGWKTSPEVFLIGVPLHAGSPFSACAAGEGHRSRVPKWVCGCAVSATVLSRVSGSHPRCSMVSAKPLDVIRPSRLDFFVLLEDGSDGSQRPCSGGKYSMGTRLRLMSSHNDH